MKTKTRKIAGHELTLVPGRRYLASRPMVDRPVREDDRWFNVKITDITDGYRIPKHAAALVGPLTYAESNRLLRAFNNGKTSFDGRVW